MSPRALVVSVLVLSAGLLLAVVMLAMLSAAPGQFMRQELSESVVEIPRPRTAEPCEELAARTEGAHSGPARLFAC